MLCSCAVFSTESVSRRGPFAPSGRGANEGDFLSVKSGLLTVEETMEALEKARSVKYKPPGS
jgi:hypothetical protein